LQQVLWNLINNAVKFTPKDGRVEVRLQRVNSDVEIRVSDSGAGISREFLPQIFQRFRQADSSASREHGGLGLGLAIAKQLVEMHGGTISADSAGLGRGAEFTVTLPMAASQQVDSRLVNRTPASEGPRHDAADLREVRVLLVEDDADSRALLKRILEGCGAETCEANSAQAALDALQGFQPHLLLSDIGMPGKDGLALISQIRSSGYTAGDLPAVALTAFAHPEDRRKALLAGFQIHLAKPVDPRKLTSTVAALVRGDRPSD
jgi:CheY-like chemotaxis protein